MKHKKIVVIGGGHGQSAICRGIKNIPDVEISAIVTVADDGGSTGRLRRMFHIPAMGDIRNVMIALAESETLMTDIMNYRFDDPDGSETDISGHNLGNLILTALTQQTGSFMEAVTKIQKVLNVKGKIIPATSQVITLLAEMEDGVVVKGEANIPTRANRIARVFYDQHVEAEPEAIEAIRQADLIIYGIGSVYTSILPNVIIPEIQEELMKAKAKKVYFCNAMTQPGETDGYCLEDHVAALKSHGVPVDAVITSTEVIPEDVLLNNYREGSTPVYIRDGRHDYDILRRSLLVFKDGLIRHDPKLIQAVTEDLVKEL